MSNDNHPVEGQVEPEKTRRSRTRNVAPEKSAPSMDTRADVVCVGGHLFGNEFCQYRMNGPGMSPTTRTYGKLPAGAYNILYIKEEPTFIPFPIKTDTIIRLPDTKSDDIIAEIGKFWTIADKFAEHGYIHKRGFLLHGPPGSGKTATIQFVIAEVIKQGGIVVMAGHPEILIEGLTRFRAIEPDRKLLVIFEDIDEIIEQYNEADILAILDGERQINHVVFIATTNYPENLDGRVKNRPSRFDRVEKIDVPSAEARREYIEYKLSSYVSAEQIDLWVKQTHGFSIAHIKELIVNVMCLGNDLQSQIERLRAMSKPVSSTDGKSSVGFGDKK